MRELPCRSEGCSGVDLIVKRGRYEYVQSCTACLGDRLVRDALSCATADRAAVGSVRAELLARLEVPTQRVDGNGNAIAALGELVSGTGRAAYLHGPAGRGKSFLALRAMARLVKSRRVTGCYVPEAVILAAHRGRYGLEDEADKRHAWTVLQSARSADVLVLDDLGVARDISGSALDELEALVCERYDRNGVLICTSNVTLERLADVRGERVASRLRDMCGLRVVGVSGRDWRAG